jgi:hypothetical protein
MDCGSSPQRQDRQGFLPDAAGLAVLGLAGIISAEVARLLGGLVALAAGECAPEDSSGFCSGGA